MNEIIAKTQGLTSEMYNYTANLVNRITDDQENDDKIIAVIALAVITAFRLSPAGAVASVVVPLVVKEMLKMKREKL